MRTTLLSITLILLGGGPALAQSIIYSFETGDEGDSFGDSVDNAGDVNGDGYDDIVIGAPGAELPVGEEAGLVRVESGFDGSRLYRWEAEEGEDLFGASVAGAGDVNRDGFADVIVGAWRTDFGGENAGSAYVFSGRTGDLLYRFDGDAPGDSFGMAVDGAGDVNGDGYADLLVGARNNDVGGQQAGFARVYSGRNGSIIHTVYGGF